jgi:hypothetical protein
MKGAKCTPVSSLTTSASSRKSSKEEHRARQDEKECNNLHKSAFKIGTTLYESVRSGENTLVKFVTADKVASEINNFFGIELVSGYMLKEGVKKGRRGFQALVHTGPKDVFSRCS